MGLAPSEKHLEDAIVKTPQIMNYTDIPDYDPSEIHFKPLARQIRLPSGIADLLILNGDCLYVTELKKGEINGETLAQVLRYMRDIRRICSIAVHGMPQQDAFGSTLFQTMNVRGLMIGYSVEVNTLNAANAVEIGVKLYQYKNGQYEFRSMYADGQHYDTLAEYAYGAIGETCRQLYNEWLNTNFSQDDIRAMYCDSMGMAFDWWGDNHER